MTPLTITLTFLALAIVLLIAYLAADEAAHR